MHHHLSEHSGAFRASQGKRGITSISWQWRAEAVCCSIPGRRAQQKIVCCSGQDPWTSESISFCLGRSTEEGTQAGIVPQCHQRGSWEAGRWAAECTYAHQDTEQRSEGSRAVAVDHVVR